MWKILKILIIAAAGLPITTGMATANMAQGTENTWKICPTAVTAQERRDNLPRHLLSAISQTESGRWNAEKQANIAWPWTVTNGGSGKFFDTKAEAMAEVELLMTQGIRNIDVGCMQINLAAHANAFETVAAAFDPAANAAYGARYLKAMHRRTGDWLKAAGAYHSRTPKFSARYRTKVTRIWNTLRRQPAPVINVAKSGPGLTETAQSHRRSTIDYGRVAALNRNFRARRGVALETEPTDPITRRGQRRQRQMIDWREAQSRGADLSVLAGMRKAERAKRRKRELISFGKADQAAVFAQRRRQQINDWRKKRLVSFGPASPDTLPANLPDFTLPVPSGS